MSTGIIVFLCIWGTFVGLLLAAVGVKVYEMRIVRKWPQAAGRVVESRVEVKRYKPGDVGHRNSDTDVVNFPYIEYEYQVGQETMRSRQVVLNETPSSFELAQRLERYPVGCEVTVYYDPVKPSRAVLERDWPPGMLWGAACTTMIFIGVPLFAIFAMVDLTAWLRQHIAHPGQASAIAMLCGMGTITFLFGVVYLKMVRDAKSWPIVRGQIVAAEVEEFQSYSSEDGGRYSTLRRPKVIYTYVVAGRKYAGDRMTIALSLSSTLTGISRRMTEKYPIGSEVDVHYNPAKPSESVLEPGSWWGLLIWICAAGLFGLAWAIAHSK